MANASKDARREERKQRSEAERLHREQMKKSEIMRRRAFFVVGLLAVAGFVAIAVMRRQNTEDRIWSAEHGHWHDRNGREIRP